MTPVPMAARETKDNVRSRTMRAVRDRDTKPEMVVRKLVHGMGYRYRLHRKGLPGKPDLVFPARRKAIFVHGCWWHGHDCKRGAREPASNRDYWLPKLQRNRARDARNEAKLHELGWETLTIWECRIKDRAKLESAIRDFLDGP